MVLNRDQEIYHKISGQNLNQSLKISKTSYTKGSVNNQKVQKFVPVLEGNLSVKNAPKRSAKYLEDKYAKSNKCKKHSSNSEEIFKSTKNFLEKVNTKKVFFPFFSTVSRFKGSDQNRNFSKHVLQLKERLVTSSRPFLFFMILSINSGWV